MKNMTPSELSRRRLNRKPAQQHGDGNGPARDGDAAVAVEEVKDGASPDQDVKADDSPDQDMKHDDASDGEVKDDGASDGEVKDDDAPTQDAE